MAVVGDDVVGGTGLAHVVDYHFPGLSEGFVVEASLTDLECMPLFFDYFLIDVDYVEALILHGILVEMVIKGSLLSVPSKAREHNHPLGQPNVVLGPDNALYFR